MDETALETARLDALTDAALSVLAGDSRTGARHLFVATSPLPRHRDRSGTDSGTDSGRGSGSGSGMAGGDVVDRALAWMHGDSDKFKCQGQPVAILVTMVALLLAVLSLSAAAPAITAVGAWVVTRLGDLVGADVRALAAAVSEFVGKAIKNVTATVKLATEGAEASSSTIEGAATGLGVLNWLGRVTGIGTGAVGAAGFAAASWLGVPVGAIMNMVTESVGLIRDTVKGAIAFTPWLWSSLRRIASALYASGAGFVHFVCYMLNLGKPLTAKEVAAALAKDAAAAAALSGTLQTLSALPPAADVAKAGQQRSARRSARRTALRSARAEAHAEAQRPDKEPDKKPDKKAHKRRREEDKEDKEDKAHKRRSDRTARHEKSRVPRSPRRRPPRRSPRLAAVRSARSARSVRSVRSAPQPRTKQ